VLQALIEFIIISVVKLIITIMIDVVPATSMIVY